MADAISLRPGMTIDTDGSVTPTTEDDGTLGCFAQINGTNKVVLLSCNHVLYDGHLGQHSFAVYQPPQTNSCCDGARAIGKVLGDGSEGQTNITITSDLDIHNPDTSHPGSSYTGTEIDCAIALLNGGISYSNMIPGIGMIAGTPTAGTYGIKPGDQVRVFRPTTQINSQKIVYGQVLDFGLLNGKYNDGSPIPSLLSPFALPVGSEDKDLNLPPRLNQIWIIPKNIPGKSDPVDFTEVGESGSVIVNDSNQVVGMIVSKYVRDDAIKNVFPANSEFSQPAFSNARNLGIANPIGKVLGALNISIPANFAATTPSFGEEDRYFSFGQNEFLSAPLRRSELLIDDLLKTKKGKLIISLIMKHSREVVELMQENPKLSAEWQHCAGPAWMAHMLNSIGSPYYRLPQEVKSISRPEALQRMIAVLYDNGSKSLQADIDRYKEFVLTSLMPLSSLHELGRKVPA